MASRKKPAAEPETQPVEDVPPPPAVDQRTTDRLTEQAAQALSAAALEDTHRDVLPHIGDHPDGTVRVLPTKGHILADVPPSGARMPIAAAEDWARNGLVVIVEDTP